MFWKKKENVACVENVNEQATELDDYIGLGDFVAKVGCEPEPRLEFDFKEWNSHSTDDIDELQRRLDAMHLVGRTISDVRFLSHVYNMTDVGFDAIIDNITGIYPSEMYKDYGHISEDFPIPLLFEMDEPVLFKFKDGDQFEILTPVEGSFNVGMNEIPWNAEARICSENVNGSRILEFSKGATITEIKVVKSAGRYFCDEDIMVIIELMKEGKYDCRFQFVFESECHDYMYFSVQTLYGKILNWPYIKVAQSIYKGSV